MPTSFQQNLKFSPKPEKLLDEFQFDGGLKTDSHETKLKPNESPDLANIIFNETGSIKTRNGYLRYNGDPLTAASDQANTGSSTATVTLDTASKYAAQTFQLSGAKNLLQINVYLAMASSGQQQLVRVELWSGNSGPNAILEQAQILLVSGTSETAYKFRFREYVALSGSTEYAIVIRPYVTSTTQSVNSVLVHQTGAAYGSGAAYSSSDAGITWAAISSADLKFVVLTSTTNVGSTGLIRYYNSSAVQQMFAKFGTGFYRGDDSTGAMTSISLGNGSNFDSAGFLDWTIVNDTLLVVDGTNRIQKYRGSTNSNYTTGTISVTNASSTVTGSGTSWNTSTNAIVGEYIKLPDGKWYKITSIGSNTSLTIEISYQGSTLSGQSYTISPWGEVQGRLNDSTAPSGLIRPTPKFIANHINRIWTLEGNTLRGSALDTSITEEHFNDWDTGSNAVTINIPPGNGDTGTGLYSLNNTLFIFQRHAIWALLGSSPANFEIRNISNEIGLIDKRTIVEYESYLLFYSGKDIYIFDGTNLKNLTDNRNHSLIDSFSSKTTPVATLWNNKYVLSFTSSGQDLNNTIVFYDITRDIFGIIEGVFASAFVRWIGGTDNGEIYFASSHHGTIYKWDTGGHDDGYEIETRYATPSIGFGSGMNDKVVKKVYLQQIALGDWSMTVNQFTNITSDDSSAEISLTAGTTSLWDVAKWDVDVWSDEASLLTNRITEFQGSGKYFKYVFGQTGYNQGVEILGINVTARQRRLQ